MLYIVHQDQVVCAADRFAPSQPSRWLVGQIVHFSAVHATVPAWMECGLLVSLSGHAWHIEIVGVARPIEPDDQALAGVTIRILRRLQSDEDTLLLASQYSERVERLSRGTTVGPVLPRQGAA